ncbi:MAG: polyprenol monophosphomannose synthase [Candidatus Niyogibacteria bacterium]|nr:MAG: polyprenol monophosphomannose synthase [Candidatus Niyogibacteria bacterium]
MASIFVVTPTYNERDNLEKLVKKIIGAGIASLKIIVVDDNSPDGTGELAEKLAKIYPLKVLHRANKSGLGTAYVHAFKKILSGEFNDGGLPDYIVQIDADLSHDPEVIMRMLAKMPECDVVLGSRYIPGGEIKNWGFLRRLISRFGNIYARLILALPHQDLTGGFKCWKKEALAAIDWNSLSSIGYNFQIETTYRAYKKGFKICEIPIIFTERKTGVSKFNPKIILESFWKVLVLRFKNRKNK